MCKYVCLMPLMSCKKTKSMQTLSLKHPVAFKLVGLGGKGLLVLSHVAHFSLLAKLMHSGSMRPCCTNARTKSSVRGWPKLRWSLTTLGASFFCSARSGGPWNQHSPAPKSCRTKRWSSIPSWRWSTTTSPGSGAGCRGSGWAGEGAWGSPGA